ncbi:MAG: peptide/nickel transport system permease protein [Solirubrobacteraceae bacterium]
MTTGEGTVRLPSPATGVGRQRSIAAIRRAARQNLSLAIGLVLVASFVVLGLLSLVWTPRDPELVDVAARLTGPGPGHLLGADALGRDVLSQLMVGARNSLLVAVVATGLSLVPGVALGLVAAGCPGPIDQVVLRLIDLTLGLPGILIALVLATVLGPGNETVIIAVAVWFTPTLARLVRGPAKQVLVADFVHAARAYGRRRPYILLRHVLPNVSPIIIVQASLMFGQAILVEAGLAYLGVGAQRPGASWGLMLFESQTFVAQHPLLAIFPGVAIMLTVLGFNLIGDGLRDVLDPRRTPHTLAT